MKPAKKKLVRLRVSFEYDTYTPAREKRIWSHMVMIAGVLPERLRVERIEPGRRREKR